MRTSSLRSTGRSSGRSPTTRRTISAVWAIALALVGSTTLGATSLASAADAEARETLADSVDVRRPGTDAVATAAPAPVQGVTPDGTVLEGTFELKRFDDRRGTLYAVGRLVGELGGHAVNQTVRLPVKGASTEAPAAGVEQPHGFARPQQVPTPGACDILTLNLGSLDLDILGLRVALSEVLLLIEAIPGAGNLLGNLLCAVAGLLDGGLLGNLLANLLGAITDLLNALLDM
jgi:hypothetical protein